MLRWLLKYEGYPPGVVFAVLLHGALILFLIGRQFQPPELVPPEKPQFITATLIQDNPQQQRTDRKREEQQLVREREQQRQAAAEKQRQAEAEKQRQAAAAKQREADAQKQRQAEAEKQRQAEAEKQRQADAEKQRQADAEKQRQAEAEKQRQAEAEKQRLAEAEQQRQAEAERQRKAEEERQAAASAAEAEASATNLVNQYSAIIQTQIYQCWNTPALARNGMVAQMEIRMVPTGEIVSSVITRSSGNDTFDRSVEQAAQCVDRIPEMMDLPSAVFDSNFRVFTMTLDFDDVSR
jgi:colicin import membrane protein